MYVCLLIPDPVGPMIQQNLHEKYILDTSKGFVKVSSHDYTAMRGTSAKSASRPASSSVDEGPRITAQCRPLRAHPTNKLHSDAPTTGQHTHDPRQTVLLSVQITLPATLSESNITSVMLWMILKQFYSCALRRTFFCFSSRPDLLTVDVRPQRDRHLAVSPVSAKLLVMHGVFVFQTMLTNLYQHI